MYKKYLKNIFKRIMNHRTTTWLIINLLYGIIKLIHLSGSFKYIGSDRFKEYGDKAPILVAVWHGRIMLIPFIWQSKRKLNALVSKHRDGRLIAGILEKIGIAVIDGSTTKGAITGTSNIHKAIEKEEAIAITPDGPKGPRMHLGRSLIYFAKNYQLPIFPITIAAAPCKIFKSWDRFMLVYPFAKGVFLCGEPFYVPSDSDDEKMETLRIELENIMIKQQNEADRLVGIEPIMP